MRLEEIPGEGVNFGGKQSANIYGYLSVDFAVVIWFSQTNSESLHFNFSKHSAQHCDTSLKSTHPTNVVFKLELSEPTKYYMTHHGEQKLTKYGILQGNGSLAVRVHRKAGEGSHLYMLVARLYNYSADHLEGTNGRRELYLNIQ